eukprot:364510-Chlamydomonas_euryale.AAC.1
MGLHQGTACDAGPGPRPGAGLGPRGRLKNRFHVHAKSVPMQLPHCDADHTHANQCSCPVGIA